MGSQDNLMAHSKTPVILFAFANDADAPLRELAVEQDELRAVFEQAEREGKCKLVFLAAATADKVILAFQENRGRVRVFHYGGHSGQDAIFLRSAYQKQKAIKADNLVEFLSLQEGLELAFLNSCLSLRQAKQYQKAGVKAVLATNQKIGDVSARKFARLFYTSMAAGASIPEAYREAEAAFQVEEEVSLRGVAIEGAEYEFPWQLFPEKPAPWRLPLVAKHLTRIPSIGLEKEFFGREADMQRLKDTLEHSPKVVLMNGLGGIGKTVLATAYVQQYGNNYGHLAWINRGESLIESVAFNEYLADTLGLPFEKEEEPEGRFRRILQKLQQLAGRNLLVIDNAQEQVAQKDIYELLPGPPNWQVLLTSRLNLGGFERLLLDTLEPGASRKLFHTYFKGECTDEELEILLKEIGYHTLTIELLAKLLDKLNNILSVSGLTEILKQKQLGDPDLQEKVWARHSGEKRGIYLHLMKAFELAKLSDREVWLLKQFVVLPVERYTATSLAGFLQEKPLGLNKVLNSLAAKGWLTRHENKTFSIHRLIRKVTEYHLQPGFDDVKELVETMIQKMSLDVHTNPLTDNGPWIIYASEVANFVGKENNEQIAELQSNIANGYYALGIYDKALQYHKNALLTREACLDVDDPKIAQSNSEVALAYLDLGQANEALKYNLKALQIYESVLEANHLDLARFYSDFFLNYRALGQYEEGLRYLKKGQQIYESVLSSKDLHLAICYNSVSIAYCDLGQYEEALQYSIKSLKIDEAMRDANHPNLASTYNNTAVIYRNLGQYDKALEYHKKCLQIDEVELAANPNHPSLAVALNNIGVCYNDLGQYQDALHYHKKALRIRELVLTTSHPDLASSYKNIATTYHGLGLYEKSLLYHKKNLAIQKGILSNLPSGLDTSYENIAKTYRALGLYDKEEEYQMKADEIRMKGK